MLCYPVHRAESRRAIEDAIVLGSLGDLWAMRSIGIQIIERGGSNNSKNSRLNGLIDGLRLK